MSKVRTQEQIANTQLSLCYQCQNKSNMYIAIDLKGVVLMMVLTPSVFV